jgi:hypothetical protein
MSMARNVGVAAAPLVGPANTVFADCVASDAVSVPDVVTGDPLTLKIAGIESATLVTVPPPPVFAIVIVPAPFVTLIPCSYVSEEILKDCPRRSRGQSFTYPSPP